MRVLITVLALWCAGMGAAAQFGKISFALDVIADRYPLAGPVALGLIVSVVGLVGLVFGTTAGLLAARIGPRRAIVAALALGAGMSLLQLLPLPYAALIATRVVEGFSHLAIVIVGPTMIAGIASPRRQGLAMTLWSSFFGVTYTLLALAAPAMLAGGGLGPLFALHAVWMAVLAAGLGWLLPDDPPAPATGGAGRLVAQHLEIYADPHVAAPALGFVFYTTIYVAVLTLLPPLMPPALVAAVAAGMPLVSIALSLTLGVWALRHMPAVRLVQAGYAAGALSVTALWLVWGQGPAMVATALVFAGAMGIVQGASFAAIPQLNASDIDRARASGAVAQLGNVGTTTGTPILAFLLARLGEGGVIAFALPLCLAGLAVHGMLAARRRP